MASRVLKKNGQRFRSTEAYTYDHMNRITEVNRAGMADSFGYYWSGELLSAQYGGDRICLTPKSKTRTWIPPIRLIQMPAISRLKRRKPNPPPPPDDTSPPDPTADTTPSPDATPPSDTPPAEDPAKGQKTVEDYLGDGKLAPDGPEPDVFTGRSVTYNLDQAGNRTSVTDNVNGNATYAPNNLNQYTSVGGSQSPTAPSTRSRFTTA